MPRILPPNPAGRASLEGGLDNGEEKQKIMCSFFGKLMLSLVGSLGNRWTCGLEPREEIWAGDAVSHPLPHHTLMEATEVDEAGQKMVLNKQSLTPPPSPSSTLPLDFVHVSFIVAPIEPSPYYPLPTPLWLLLQCS